MDKTQFRPPGILLTGKSYWDIKEAEWITISRSDNIRKGEISLTTAIAWANKGRLFESIGSVKAVESKAVEKTYTEEEARKLCQKAYKLGFSYGNNNSISPTPTFAEWWKDISK